jgi:hypothetical protein
VGPSFREALGHEVDRLAVETEEVREEYGYGCEYRLARSDAGHVM